MNNSIVIRKGKLDDLDNLSILFDLYRRFYEQESDIMAAKSFLNDRMKNNESIIFIAIDLHTNQSIGFTQLYPSFSSVSMQRSWILNDLYVIEKFRRGGVGNLLLDSAKRFAKETNSKGLALSTAVDNVKAQRLYENQGYQRETSFYHYYLRV